MTYSTKLTSKSQMTLTRGVRERLGVKPGDEVTIQFEGDRAFISKKDFWNDFEDLRNELAMQIQGSSSSVDNEKQLKDKAKLEAWHDKEKRSRS